MEFRTGVSGREMNDPEREKERERERTKRNGESVFKKNGRVSQWKTGAAGVSNKIRADARSRVIDIENVSPRANSLASIRPITFSPTPLFWHLFVIAASRDRISTRRDTRLLLDGISNCNDSSPTVCSSYCFPISGPRRNCADTTEGGKGRLAERNTPPTVEEENRASSLSWLLSSPEYSLARVFWYDSYAKETFALGKKSGYRHYIGRNICQQFVRQCKFVKWWNVTFVKVLTKRKKKNGWLLWIDCFRDVELPTPNICEELARLVTIFSNICLFDDVNSIEFEWWNVRSSFFRFDNPNFRWGYRVKRIFRIASPSTISKEDCLIDCCNKIIRRF